MNAECAGKTVRSLENASYLSALEVYSQQGAIQIHVHLTFTLQRQCHHVESADHNFHFQLNPMCAYTQMNITSSTVKVLSPLRIASMKVVQYDVPDFLVPLSGV